MGKCIICNKNLKAGQRSDTKYCSQKCRSKAYTTRRASEKRLQASQLDMLQLQDLKTIKMHSQSAADFIVKCSTLVDKHFAEEALDAMWELALACGCDLTERFGRYENN